MKLIFEFENLWHQAYQNTDYKFVCWFSFTTSIHPFAIAHINLTIINFQFHWSVKNA